LVTPADSIDFDPPLHETLTAAQRWLEEQQLDDGSWAGILESNACIEAEWLLAFHLLGYEFPDSSGLISGILDRQRQDGSWETYYGAVDGDINSTVECYAALRA
jgi:squalene-hopene/tetraprenyl-beta-curcumene cyclase